VQPFYFLWRSLSIFALAVVALMGGACGSGVALHPARGKVLVAGKPAVGATVVFHPAKSSAESAYRTPAGVVQADGSFILSTFAPGDGAPAGEYIVAISPSRDAGDAKSKSAAPIKLALKYGDIHQTPLRATVVEGANEITAFELPK
jgi:hypothetical protein